MTTETAIKNATLKIKTFLDEFEGTFPAEASKDYVYPHQDNVSWTSGFYSGMLWLCYELTGDPAFKKAAEEHYESHKDRIVNEKSVDHHDIGFLYTLSTVAQYKITGDPDAKEISVKAADVLMRRFQKKGGFIQAWGPMDDPDSYRLIVDCLLNLPLLFWATEATGDPKYRDAATTHMKTAIRNVIRDDSSTFHTFYFDPETGAPLRGVTHQGYADDSCWARGQAWAVCGLALCYHYTKDPEILPYYERVTNYFINHLPADYVPYWDMIFDETSGMPRDTSAAAIAICGIYEMEKYHPNAKHKETADKMLASLEENYNTEALPNCQGLLTDGMYNWNDNPNPECNIWGDYFYLEALMRAKDPDWKMYF